MDTLTLSFQIKANKLKNNGQAPLVLRVTIGGCRFEISTKISIEPKKWDSARRMVKGNSEEARTINNLLSNFENRVQREFNLLYEKNNGKVSSEELKRALSGDKKQVKTLIEVFEEHNRLLEKEVGLKVVKKTYQRYTACIERLKQFLKQDIADENIRLDELDYKFLKRFDNYLAVNYDCGHNMVMTYLKKLKKVIHQAMDFGYISHDPFRSYKTAFKEKTRDYLSQDELERLKNTRMPIKRLEEVRDTFIFQCYTGIAYSDLKELSLENIQTSINNAKIIVLERTKTGVRAVIPILDEANEIIEKYKNHPVYNSAGLLIPIISNQKMNAYLKEIAILCKINKQLSSHIARHTFATTVTLSNGIPLETVQKMLGHSKISTTQIYSKVIDNKVVSDMELLNKKLIGNRAV